MWALSPGVRHLNHGSFGAVPVEVLEKQDEWRRRWEANTTAFFLSDLQPGIDQAHHACRLRGCRSGRDGVCPQRLSGCGDGDDPGGLLSPLNTELLDAGFETLVMIWPQWPHRVLRVSAHYYNTLDEYRALASHLSRVRV